MTNPVLVISDTHYHNFTQYAQIGPKGINTRLADTIRATVEAAMELRRRGGKVIVHCGDVFHVRGQLAPSVLNPVVDMYRKLIADGFEVHMISGNHDLETDKVSRVSSSVSALEAAGVKVYHESTMVEIEGAMWHFVPWIKDLTDLRASVKLPAHGVLKCTNLVIHAPLNGVITGIPDHGLSPKDFAGLGYSRVFVGHYHNHRRFDEGDTVIFSVGALTHQNWGDVGSQCGYMLVHGGAMTQIQTKAPLFVRIPESTVDTVSSHFIVDNYVKVVDGTYTDPADIQAIKDKLLLQGAKAVVVEGLIKRPAVTRTMGATTTAPTVESILGDYLDRAFPGDAAVKSKALEIMQEANGYSS